MKTQYYASSKSPELYSVRGAVVRRWFSGRIWKPVIVTVADLVKSNFKPVTDAYVDSAIKPKAAKRVKPALPAACRVTVNRQPAGIYVALALSNGHHVIIKRAKASAWSTHPKWSAQYQAEISWSGGNGSESIPQTGEMIEHLRWAVSIARNLNVLNPDKSTDEELTWPKRL